MTIRVRIVGVAILAAMTIGPAEAAPGYVVDGVNLRAGPGLDYPVLAPLPPGTPTEIFGCLEGWTWCDVAVNGSEGALRGWAAGPRLQLADNGQPVDLPQYGTQFGLPVIGFDLDSYWGTYYRGEPWYGDRGRWHGDFHGAGDAPRGFAGEPRGFYGGGSGPGGFREGGVPRPGVGLGAPAASFHPGAVPGGGHGGPPAAPERPQHFESRGGAVPDHRSPN